MSERVWCIEEDEFLRSLVFQYACFKADDWWGYIATMTLDRSGEECRKRWFHLNHNGPFNAIGQPMIFTWNGMQYCGNDICHPDLGLPCPYCSYATIAYSSIERY
jgi:hypothetical protein